MKTCLLAFLGRALTGLVVEVIHMCYKDSGTSITLAQRGELMSEEVTQMYTHTILKKYGNTVKANAAGHNE